MNGIQKKVKTLEESDRENGDRREENLRKEF